VCADAVIHLADALEKLSNISDLPLYPPYSHILERDLRQANLEVVQRWLEFDKTPAHADRFMDNVLLVVKRLQKLEDEALKLPQAKWPGSNFTLNQLNGVEGQKLHWEFEQIRERARESAKYLRQLAWMIRSERKGDKASKIESKEQLWLDDAPDYIMNSDAIKLAEFANRRLSLSTLSKLLEPDGPIRYMRKRRPLRCKVHIGDFVAFMKTLPQIRANAEHITSETIEEYVSDGTDMQAQIKELKG
jgi:hypothetical protein